MKIGIIGSGNMGRSIGVRLAEGGHAVAFGGRDAAQAAAAAARAGHSATAGSNDEAAAFGQVVIWTTRVVDAAEVLDRPEALAGKVVIDLNNRDFQDSVAAGELPGQALGEMLQASSPSARVVKALNTIPMETFDCDPADLRAVDAQTFIAGDDAGAKSVVAELTGQLGLRAIDLGTGAVAMRAVEALGDIIRLYMSGGENRLSAHLRLDTLPSPLLATTGERRVRNYH
jgi:hypothetical protein